MASNNFCVEKSSTSIIKFKHFTYKWTIDDFENLLTKDLKTNINGFKYIESNIFSPPNDDRVQFKIVLYPNGVREEAKNNVSIYLHRISSVDRSTDVYYKISILNENNDKCHIFQIRYTFEENVAFGWPKYITCAELLNASNRLLCNRKLTVNAELGIAENEIQISRSRLNSNSLDNEEPETVTKIDNFSYKWEIKNFNSILNTKKNGAYIESDLFHFPQNDQARFFLRFYPNGIYEIYKDYISLTLGLETCDKSEVIVKCKYEILDILNQKIFCEVIMSNFKKGTTKGPLDLITKNELLTKAKELLPEDTLTIICELQVFENKFLCKETPKVTPIPQVTSILDSLNSSSNIKSSKTYTHLEVAKFSHTWTVGNFKVRCDEQLSENAFLDSKQFSPLSDNPIKFNLRIYPRGYGKESHTYVSVYLVLASCEQIKVTVECRISIVNSIEDKCFTQVLKGVIYRGSKRGIEKFIQRDILLSQATEFLPYGNLTIICELGIVGDSKVDFEELPPDQSLPSAIGQDFGQLIESGEHSDVVFVLEGKEVRAHKAFLASRSAVFSAMFRNNMRESNENRIEITDIGLEVFRDLLSYIYSGKYQPKDQNIADLFVAADKYDLQNLKDLSENSLCSLVNSETVADLLTLADRHNADKLKTTLFDYINLQSPWLMKNENFISKISKQLVVELYNDMIDKQNF